MFRGLRKDSPPSRPMSFSYSSFEPVSKEVDQILTEMAEGPGKLREGHGLGINLMGNIVQYVEII